MKYSRNGFRDVDSAWDCLTKTSDDLGSSQSLTKGQLNRISRVTKSPTGKSPSRAERKHTRFLSRVLRIDTTCYKLCAIAFSQHKIDSTKDAILDRLVKTIYERHRDATSIPGIQTLLADTGNPPIDRLPQESNQGLASAKEGWIEIRSHKEEDIQGVLRKELVNVVGAVTMRFPKFPNLDPGDPTPCYMDLELGGEYVNQLTMALFRVKVDWVEEFLHVVHENDMLQIIRDPNFTLTRVVDDVIAAVFQSDIHVAIRESAARMKELAKGESRTECVVMSFSRDKSTIGLTMNLMHGIRIQGRLTANAP